jgi:hypothetical protein
MMDLDAEGKTLSAAQAKTILRAWRKRQASGGALQERFDHVGLGALEFAKKPTGATSIPRKFYTQTTRSSDRDNDHRIPPYTTKYRQHGLSGRNCLSMENGRDRPCGPVHVRRAPGQARGSGGDYRPQEGMLQPEEPSGEILNGCAKKDTKNWRLT